MRINEVGHAYLVGCNADMMVGGASFRLAPPNQLLSASGFPGTVVAIIKPEVGVYFDEAGTLLHGSATGGEGEIFTMSLMMRDWDHPVDSLMMSLDLPPSVSLVSATQPDGHGFAGEWETGATLSFSPPIEAPGETPLLMATLQLDPGSDLVFGAEIHVGGHQDFPITPLVLVSGIGAYEVSSLTSTLTIPIANEARSWSDVKTLYR